MSGKWLIGCLVQAFVQAFQTWHPHLGVRISFWLSFRFQHTALQTAVHCLSSVGGYTDYITNYITDYTTRASDVPITATTSDIQITTTTSDVPQESTSTTFDTHVVTTASYRHVPRYEFRHVVSQLHQQVLLRLLGLHFCCDLFLANYFFKVFYLFWFSFGLARSV